MDVDNLSMKALGSPDSTPGVDDGLEGLLSRCVNVNELDALPMRKVVVGIAGAANDRDVIALLDETREQLLAMRLDTTHDVGDAARTGDYYAIFFFFHDY